MSISLKPRPLLSSVWRHAVWHCAACILVLSATPAWSAGPAGIAQEPPNLGQLKSQLKDYYAHEYQSQVALSLKEADGWLRERALKVKRPALVLDIDETSLSNWEEIEANDFAYIVDGECAVPPKMPCGALAWDQSTRAKALAPTLSVYETAMKLKVAVFFVTGRFDEPVERAATELNLWKQGYRGWEKVVMRTDHAGSVEAFKTQARKSIEEAGFSIIANIGDQDSDLRGGHAERVFKVPNPFYWIP
jgi:predicted secreted acid phosphatase